MEKDSKNEKSSVAAAWSKNADPLAGAAYLSATRRGGSEWRSALAGTTPPATIADVYRSQP